MGELTATPKVKRGAVLVCRGGSGSRCAEAAEKLGCHLKQADDGGGDRDAGVRQQGRSEGRSRQAGRALSGLAEGAAGTWRGMVACLSCRPEDRALKAREA